MNTYLETQLRTVLNSLDGIPDDFAIEFQQPARPEHGDLATNTALKLARPLRQNPRAIAETLKAQLDLDPNRIESVEIAGPGFINFRFSKAYFTSSLSALLEADASFGRSNIGNGTKAMVEYVSANPTGPLTVGHGRNAVLGDTVANLLDWIGYDVTREYYFNDAGRQMRVLGQSVRARALALLDPDHPTKTLTFKDGTSVVVPEAFPEDGYLGDYIIDIAGSVVNDLGEEARTAEDEVFIEAAKKAIFAEIDQTLSRLGIHMDHYFNERSMYENNRVWEVIETLREKDLAYDKEGAVWFKTTAFGKENDTVLVKSTGEPTYRLPDIAYHADKLDRGFEIIVDVFGADHIATYPDVLSGIEALGYDTSGIDVVIYQFVTLIRGGEQVKMSTRRATYETLDDLMDEVSEDVTRFFFLMRSANTHLEFDLDLAKEASAKNPVFYLQYAHARTCNIKRKTSELGLTLDATPDFDLLTHPAEIDLIKVLLHLPEEIQKAAEAREPHRLATYLREVATFYSKFYQQCLIIGEETSLATARLHLNEATGIVLRNGLTVLGISAPDHM